MDVSIIIINYNTFSLTSQCIQSVLEKTSGLEFEIILVDNASTECETTIFKEIFPQIRFIKNEYNEGFAKGNNVGISIAKGEYILLLNSDTLLLNNAVLYAYEILKEDDSIGVVSGQCLFPDGTAQGVAGRYPSIMRELRELFRINKFLTLKERQCYFLGDEWNYNYPVDADWVWGAFFMFKRSDLENFPNQRLHDTFFMYGEDLQWCYFFKKVLCKKILFHPKPKLLHFIGGSDKDKQSSFEKYVLKMLPHEYIWMTMVKGLFYTRLYYLIKGAQYISLRTNCELRKGLLYLKISILGNVYFKN